MPLSLKPTWRLPVLSPREKTSAVVGRLMLPVREVEGDLLPGYEKVLQIFCRIISRQLASELLDETA